MENYANSRPCSREAFTITAQPILAECSQGQLNSRVGELGLASEPGLEKEKGYNAWARGRRGAAGAVLEEPDVPDDNRQRRDWTDMLDCDRAWHYRYNRSLSMASHGISCLSFSKDARWLISGTGSGDLKVWATASWSVAQTLKCCRKEEPRALLASPSQTWLASVQPSALHVFQFKAPFHLEQAIPAMICPGSKEISPWCCAAFSPGIEVDHDAGRTGENNHFVALSSSHLCVFDYSAGWSSETPRRTHSILRYARPTGVSYTPCKLWVIIAYDNGQMQIWNADSLTLHRKLRAHEGAVRCMDISPVGAKYAYRLATVGQDHRIRLWPIGRWNLEEERREKPRDKAGEPRDEEGVICCSFSANGTWFLTISRVLCVWRVCMNSSGRIFLCLHQRLDAIGSVDGLCAAAFSSCKDALALGSRDGALGVYQRYAGLPADFPYEEDEEEDEPTPRTSSPEVWTMPSESSEEPERVRRPMRRVSLDVGLEGEGVKQKMPATGPDGWFQKWKLKSTTTAVPHPLLGCSSTLRNSGSSPSLAGAGESRRTPSGNPYQNALPTASLISGSTNCRSSPDLKRWSCRHFDAVLKAETGNCHQGLDQGLSRPHVLK